MISTVKIANFKSIQQQTIELRALNVLIGQNGAGKSNFISLFRFLEQLSEQDLQSFVFQNGGIEDYLYNGFETSQEIAIALEFPLPKNTQESNLYRFRIESNGEQFRFVEESVGFWKKDDYSNPWQQEIGHSDTSEANLKQAAATGKHGRVAGYVYRYLTDLRLFHFHDTSDNARSKVPQPIDDVYHFKSEGDNLAPFLLYFRNHHPQEYFRIVETVRLIYPLFQDFVLEESPYAKGKVLLRWRESASGQVFSANQMSDGTLRFVCLATLLTQPPDTSFVPSTIVLDEPELGLHPFAIEVLADLLYKATQSKQVVVATQSANLVNFCQPHDMIVVERDAQGASTFRRLEDQGLEEWLEDYSLGQLWERNLLGGRP